MILACATAPKRNSLHWEQGSVSWEEICAWPVSDQKEAGNYLLGTLRTTTAVHKPGQKPCGPALHRRKDAVVSRSAIALDVDFPDRSFCERIEMTFPWAAMLHTTYSSTPDDLHYRLLVPTDREMAPDEYVVACRSLMQQLGTHQFDPSTDQPERYMFRPSAQRPEWFVRVVLTGPLISVATLLADFEPDLSVKPMPAPARNKRDPFAIDGVIGAFNRAYENWDLLIEAYDLPYSKVSDDRYQLAGARSEAGMGPIRDALGFVYSHHINDPAYGKACSAFDLVRLHRFAELDEGAKPQTSINKLPSQTAMLDLASGDHRVTAELVGVAFAEAMDDEVVAPNQWRIGLRLAQRTGKFVDCIHNWDLVRANDPVFGLLRYNELTLSPEFAGDVPWRRVDGTNRTVTVNDRWEFVHYVEREYNIRPTMAYLSALIDGKSWQHVVNPVRDYLDGLVWDGKPRLETCLPGVRVNPYTRLVARKALVAAVARMFEPGVKWDHTLVLKGDEGLGKTWWIERMARGYASSLGRIDNKDTLLVMQRSWIVVSDESHSLRKSDQDAQKEFLTRTSDVFRMPYDRETLVHRRHCVIWSTTNEDTFLRRQQGNRRFLVVHCEERVDFAKMTDDYIDQVWAEAVYLYRAGENLYLGEIESATSAAERESFIEEDALVGFIEEFLSQRYPEDWWQRSVDARLAWLDGRAAGFEPEGTMLLDRTCSAQLWVEALGRRKGDARRADLLDITNVMKDLPGWRALPNRPRIPGYGPQLVFIRDDLL